MTLPQLLDAWNTFFHAEVSCATLVIFRIAIGFLLMANVLLLLPLVNDYFSADGLWPTAVWMSQTSGSRFCLLSLMPPTTNAFRLLLLVHFVASVGFLAGFQFRLCSVVVFLTLVSIHHRNAYILSSGDTLLRLLIFFTCFSDANGGLSVDAWRAGKSLTEFATTDPWPMRLMQIQISIVYLRTVFWKLRGKMWWDGTAAWYPLWVEAYVRYRPPGWMLRPAFIRLATWGTLIDELCMATLIWIRELRYPMLVTGIVFHLMLDMIMNLQFFSWIMICSLLLFVFPEDAERCLVLIGGWFRIG